MSPRRRRLLLSIAALAAGVCRRVRAGVRAARSSRHERSRRTDSPPRGRETGSDRALGWGRRRPAQHRHSRGASRGFGIQAGGTLIIDPKDGIIPYQPWALTERNRRREDANGYEDQVGHCEFYDIARVVSFPMEIMHSGNQVILNQNQHITRAVDMNRREHLPSGIRLWLGDPIGRWEGDTLVVDITNFAGKTRMALGGDFYSADAHIVEKFTMKDSNTIEWTMTFDDPKVFTRPWTMTSHEPMKRVRPGENFDAEDTCHEGNVDLVHLKNVYDQAYPDGRPVIRTGPDSR